MSSKMPRYFEFEKHSEESWQNFAFSELTNIQKLLRETSEGMRLKPLYTEADLKDYSDLLRDESETKTLPVVDIKKREYLEEAKELGVQTYYLCLDEENLKSEVNPFKIKDFDGLFIVDFKMSSFPEALFWQENLQSVSEVHYLFDPILLSLKRNQIYPGLKNQMSHIWKFHGLSGNLNILSVDGHHLNKLGLTDADELSHIMYILEYYVAEALDQNISLTKLMSRIIFKVALGSDFFKNIAKLRALKLLLHRFFYEKKGTIYSKDDFFIMGMGSDCEKQSKDLHSNILRETTANFSAQIAGIPFFKVSSFSKNDKVARRLSQSTFHVLCEEAGAGAVKDAAGGSYYLDSLTDQLAQKAWQDYKACQLKNSDRENYFFQGPFFEKVKESKKRDKKKMIGVDHFINQLPSCLNIFEVKEDETLKLKDRTPFEGVKQTDPSWGDSILNMKRKDNNEIWTFLKNALLSIQSEVSREKKFKEELKPFHFGGDHE